MWSNTAKPTTNVEFIATQALDFLVTQDGDYLITNQSNIWSKIKKAITSWTNILK